MRHLAGMPWALAALACAPAAHALDAAEVAQHGVTIRFAQPRPVGRFVTGDPWVVGPVRIVEIANALNHPDFTPGDHQNGAMVNPLGRGKQGYDGGLDHRRALYDPALNAARPNGRRVAADNPLDLPPGQSLVAAVSWLYRDEKTMEPGGPKNWNATRTPRPALRSTVVLTCLDAPPPEDAFRPPYCGDPKPLHRRSTLKTGLLKKLPAVPNAPDLEATAQRLSRPWIDHVAGWGGALTHATDNMPEYGRDMCYILNNAALLLHLDFPDERKEALLTGFVQLGIDLAAIARTGGRWPPDGGHGAGRKWPILFAGLMLDDADMKNVGQWETPFQEDAQTFHITAEDVARSNGADWKPDTRAPTAPYRAEHVGLPEWGIRHATNPRADNYHWKATYRDINNSYIPGFALAALIMDQKRAWNHDPMFDYADLVMETVKDWNERGLHNRLPEFVRHMWAAYRPQFGEAPKTYNRPPAEPE